MNYKVESIKVKDEEEKESVVEGKTQPYTWAVEVLRRLRTERNAKTPDQIFLQREKAKDKIKEITINHWS
jgi:hypothetical protein